MPRTSTVVLVAAGAIVLVGFGVQLVPGHSVPQLVASTSIVSAGIPVACAATPALILDASPARSAVGSAVFGMVAATAAPTPGAFTTLYLLGAAAALLAVLAASAIGRTSLTRQPGNGTSPPATPRPEPAPLVTKENPMRETSAYVAVDSDSPLTLQTIRRRDLRPGDVAIDVTFCGVCHSDLHEIHRPGNKPLVAGHEFVGTVTATGREVTRFQVGHPVAIGNIVDSCGTCSMCAAGQENYCEQYPTLTYGGTDRLDGTPTQGGYASEYVADEKFVYPLPATLDPAGVAPLMCAGITVWEPLVRWSTGPGKVVGIVGLGGLGHLAVKFAHALGAHVVLFTTSEEKAAGAKALGADEVVVSRDLAAMSEQANRFDLILDTASAPHDLTPYIRALALDGTLCALGALGSMQFDPFALLIGRKSLASAGSGGTKGTQAMLDFCNEHGIVADVEVLPARDINDALARLERNDVRFRFALDMKQM